MLRRWNLVIADISETLLPPSQATWEQVHMLLPFTPTYPSILTLTLHLLSHHVANFPILLTLTLHFSISLLFSTLNSSTLMAQRFLFPFIPALLLPPVPRPGASPLHSSPESGSTPAVHGAFGQTHVQRLRRLVCHSPTSSKGS